MYATGYHGSIRWQPDPGMLETNFKCSNGGSWNLLLNSLEGASIDTVARVMKTEKAPVKCAALEGDGRVAVHMCSRGTENPRDMPRWLQLALRLILSYPSNGTVTDL